MRANARNVEQLPDARDLRVAVVVADFYPPVADALIRGAREALDACGVDAERCVEITVPGCFELPLAAQRAIEVHGVDAVVALGAVVRGETSHFDFVAGECARGVMAVQLATGVPIGFGVLTTDTLAQAEQRADRERGNKGFHATVAALTVAVIGRTAPAATAMRR